MNKNIIYKLIEKMKKLKTMQINMKVKFKNNSNYTVIKKILSQINQMEKFIIFQESNKYL